jgi:beta-xylosidase
MKLKFFSLLLIAVSFFNINIRSQSITGSWGDQGNGTYINPVLNADYSDPDVIRVNDKFYMVCSEFHFMGMPVLESSDMVNWKIIAQVYNHLDFPEYATMDRYAGGSWAPSIRYHDNKFWIYFCTPDEGLFMSTAEKPEGPWAPLYLIKAIPKWEDPCPFWDEDGKAYLGHSLWGAGPIIIHKMSADGKHLLDDGVTVYTGSGAEGTKIFKLNGWYYVSIPEGGFTTGWQTVLRSKNIYGPFEKKVIFERGSTNLNGPHQGALVDTPEGQWWFYHFASDGAMGRVVHLQPVNWKDGWPLAGVDINGNGIGEPVHICKKPDIIGEFKITAPQSDDDFSSPSLGLQWQWNHNPVNNLWSLTEKPGFLILKAGKAESFVKAHNTLTQKVMGTTGEAVTEMDLSGLADGQKAGLCSMGGRITNLIGVLKRTGQLYLFTETNGKVTSERPVKFNKIFLKVSLDIKGDKNQFFYSADNKSYTSAGELFTTAAGYWKGTRIGLYSYNEQNENGSASFNSFIYNYDGPKGR